MKRNIKEKQQAPFIIKAHLEVIVDLWPFSFKFNAHAEQ